MRALWGGLLAVGGCDPEGDPARAPTAPDDVVGAIDLVRLRDEVDWLAGDARGGRVPGTPGHAEAVDRVASAFAAAGLEPVGPDWVHPFPLALERARWGLDAAGQVVEIAPEQIGTNVLGVWRGTDPVAADEVVLLIAHLDHLGVTPDGRPYNGAVDDGVAVCALMELARAWSEAGVRYPRSIALLVTDAEEDGLDGAEVAVADEILPLASIVAAVSVDPIGRPVLTDYAPLFVIGAERSPELTAAVAGLSAGEVRRLSRTPILGFASDQDAFWGAPSPVPSLWVTSGGMSFYHTVDDDPVTVDYRSVRSHVAILAELVEVLAGDPAVRPVDRGPQPLSVDDLQEAVLTLDGALASAELDDGERALGYGFRDTLSDGVARGEPVGGEAVAAYVELLLYVIQELTPAHPGPIPPPFPSGG